MTVRPAALIRALILDRRHRCLLVQRSGDPEGAWEVPSVHAPWPERPLLTVREGIARSLGLTLPSPSGSCVPQEGTSPRDFAFLLGPGEESQVVQPDPAEIAAAQWLPLARAGEALGARGEGDAFFRVYVETMLGGYEPPRRDLDVFYFGNTPELAAKLAHLVVKGRKRATSCWIEAAEKAGETLPSVGLMSVVTDYHGYPQCVTETMEVRKVPFGEVAEDVAVGEGEGDLTYEDWREVHLRYFTEEGAALGLTFDDRSIVLNEIFRVIRVLGAPSA